MTPSCTEVAVDVLGILRAHRFSFTCEIELQDGIASLLEALPGYAREVRLSAYDRPDFMVGTTAIEVKVDGSLAALLRQLYRYARHEAVQEIIVVTSRRKLAALPASLGAKPVTAVVVGAL